MKIVVLAGGLSGERNVSLSSGCMVAEALRSRGHRVALVDLYFGLENWKKEPEDLYDATFPAEWKTLSRVEPDLEAVRKARKMQSPSPFGPGVLDLCQKADVTFLALHGDCGEDGRIQAALSMHNIVYTGSDYLSSGLAMSKDMAKRLVAPEGVPTASWEMVTLEEDRLPELIEKTPLPVVVKPNNAGSSIGVAIAHTREELAQALHAVRAMGNTCMLEQYISGREIQVALLGDRALPSIEITPKEGFYDYANKYVPGATEEVSPAPIPAEWEERLGQYALKVFHLLGLEVYARVDFIVTPEGIPYFLEINSLPGMTPTSLIPQEAAAAGISYEELCEAIVLESLRIRS